jgi:hypothetical protein
VSDEFPAELKHFVAQHIESLPQLETLLLMQHDPQRDWSCADLAQSLYISSDMCAGIVTDLERGGFVARVAGSDRYRFACTNADSERLLTQLGAFYRERRVAVITQIYSNPVRKVQTFADAFRLRREEK